MFSGKEIVDSLIQHTQHNSTSKQEGIQTKERQLKNHIFAKYRN